MTHSYLHRYLAVACLMLSGVLVAPPARAAPIDFGSNSYTAVGAVGISWANADTAAAATMYMGVSGHLATITSAAENNFLSSNFSVAGGFAGAWLGGDVTGSGPAVGTWVVGPETGQVFSHDGLPFGGAYANWGGIEPNNSPSRPYMNLGSLTAGIATGQWADAGLGLSSANDPIVGYLIEFEGTAAQPVPEPATLALLGFGLAGLGIMRRRRRKSA